MSLSSVSGQRGSAAASSLRPRWKRGLVRIAAALLMTGTTASLLIGTTASYADVDVPVQLGPRPFYLVEQLEPGPLKDTLRSCAANTLEYQPTDFSIGHRGAALQFPEHTKESYQAAIRMGAGIVECDVTFTSDAELVCRHAQCDLHTTTNILTTPLAEKCAVPFTPAVFDEKGELETPATARCCASDLTLAEFKSLSGKMDAADRNATTLAEYLGGTPSFRTELYATGGTLVSHAESITLIRARGGKFTPELKAVTDGFGESGLTQETYARQMIEEYKAQQVPPEEVWAQSFDYKDVELWIEEFPKFGEQAVFLDGRDPLELAAEPPSVADFHALAAAGLNIIAPPMPTLLATGDGNMIVPSEYAMNARAAGLDIISWSLERSGRIDEDVRPAGGAYYYDTTVDALSGDGEILNTVDVLAQQVGIIGLFSDWPATTSFYANCLGLK